MQKLTHASSFVLFPTPFFLKKKFVNIPTQSPKNSHYERKRNSAAVTAKKSSARKFGASAHTCKVTPVDLDVAAKKVSAHLPSRNKWAKTDLVNWVGVYWKREGKRTGKCSNTVSLFTRLQILKS